MADISAEDDFEDGYVLELERRLQSRALWIKYKRDRAAIDLGLHLREPGTQDLTRSRVWFQLKGLQASTWSPEQFAGKGAYADVRIKHLRKWYSAPEVVYLAIWVESVGEFVAIDVRDLVEDRWGVDVRWDEVGKPGKKTVRVWIEPSRILDDNAIKLLGRHQSVRLDHRTWRGRDLGHRLDPLRNELEPVEPTLFIEVVDALLAAHDYFPDEERDPFTLLANHENLGPDQCRLLVGRLFNTFEWPFALSIEYGYSDPEEASEQGQWFSALGKISVLIVAKKHGADELVAGPDAGAGIAVLQQAGVNNMLVFCNDEDRNLGPFRTRDLSLVRGTPIGLAALSVCILLTPSVYREFSDRLRWRRPVNVRA